ncbi:MAG: hypothetical protein ACFFCW_30715 [Candidatus Hodarchaeota archaeon]
MDEKYQVAITELRKSFDRLWQAVQDGQFDSRSILGDELLNMKDVFNELDRRQPEDSADAKQCDNFKCVFEGECRNWNICKGFIQHG